jgi:signal transduction histidine kinase
LPLSHGAALYRIAQEALANAYRHANATKIGISLIYGPKEVGLRVKDDGIGFDARQSRGMGLGHISERVRELGGQMTVEAAPGKGVILGATLPVGAHNDSNSYR